MMKTLRFGLTTASVLALSTGVALADFELNILHINDFHSRIESVNKYDSTCSAEETFLCTKGGYSLAGARWVQHSNQVRTGVVGHSPYVG